MAQKSDEYTEYQKHILNSFPNGCEDEGMFRFVLNAPEQYEVEDEMLKYSNEHPKATVEEMFNYFASFVPQGLPPCASEWEDDEDE